MRIGFDGFPFGQYPGGVGHYARALFQSLLALNEENIEMIAYIPSGMTERDFPLFPHDLSSACFLPTSRFFLRWRGQIDGLDLFHGTNFKIPTRGRFGAILTIHDLWLDRHPEYSKKVFGQKFSTFRAKKRAEQASHILAISQATAHDIEMVYGIPRQKISVIYPGVSEEFYPDPHAEPFSRVRQRIGLAEQPYLLFIGGADPRKNHQTVFQAFSECPELRQNYSMVAVGDCSHHMGDMVQTAKQFDIMNRLLFPGSVSLDELRALYTHARLFVFPSRCEGFGFPVLEAMACGVPVVTSKTTALPEVAGDAAVLVDPDNPSELGEAMRRVLGDSQLAHSLKDKGFKRVKRFSWVRAAQETLNVYRMVCQ